MLLVIRDAKIVGFRRCLCEEDTGLSSGPSFKPISSISPGEFRRFKPRRKAAKANAQTEKRLNSRLLPFSRLSRPHPQKLLPAHPRKSARLFLRPEPWRGCHKPNSPPNSRPLNRMCAVAKKAEAPRRPTPCYALPRRPAQAGYHVQPCFIKGPLCNTRCFAVRIFRGDNRGLAGRLNELSQNFSPPGVGSVRRASSSL